MKVFLVAVLPLAALSLPAQHGHIRSLGQGGPVAGLDDDDNGGNNIQILSTDTATNSSPYVPDSSSAIVQLGPRPYYLIQHMKPTSLKVAMSTCAHRSYYGTSPLLYSPHVFSW